jgi:hypothetical protein
MEYTMKKAINQRLSKQLELSKWMTDQASFETKPTNPVKLDIP